MVQAPEMGFSEVNIQDGDINAETQQKQVEDFINQQYDMILIDPVSPDGIQPTLDKAEAAEFCNRVRLGYRLGGSRFTHRMGSRADRRAHG